MPLSRTHPGPFESMQSGRPAMWGWENLDRQHDIPSVEAGRIHSRMSMAKPSWRRKQSRPGQEGRWHNEIPYSLKTLGDWMYCQGLNRYVFSRVRHASRGRIVAGMTNGPMGFSL